MKLLFERETELGPCDRDRVNGHFSDEDGTDWMAFAFTTAAMTSSKGLVRIEQRCYLRSAGCLDEIRSQSWIQPEMTLEPILAGQKETLVYVQKLHQEFVDRSRQQFIELGLISDSPQALTA